MKSNSGDIVVAARYARRAMVGRTVTVRRGPKVTAEPTPMERLAAWQGRHEDRVTGGVPWYRAGSDRRTTALVERRRAAVARLWRLWSRRGYDTKARVVAIRALARDRADMAILDFPIVRDALRG